MCGIAGYYKRYGSIRDADHLIRMSYSIRHRGPDDEGFVFINDKTGHVLNCSGGGSDRRIADRLPSSREHADGFPHNLAFAHRRYSIIDLSPDGHQPMWNAEEDLCVSFNGEIYNYVELRLELEKAGCRFRTQSDTEVILHAYRLWGTDAFARFNGPWAIALFDKRNKGLLLSRDRIGKAPLYYAQKNGIFYWASEIKSIIAACGAQGFPVREQAIDDYVLHGWRDLDGTFWSGIEDFPSASFALIKPDLSLDRRNYWALPDRRLAAGDISTSAAAAQLNSVLTDAIRIRMRCDVPVAFELSGGMDSSSLVALAATALNRQLSTYTIKFEEKDSDEEPFARALFGLYKERIKYHVIEPGQDDFWEDADRFIGVEEEPFHAPNLHTEQKLLKAIREDGAKVMISGAGGDELLAGYPSEYFMPFLAYLASKGKMAALIREIFGSSQYSPKASASALLKRALRRAVPNGYLLSRRQKGISRMAGRSAYRRPPQTSPRLDKAMDFHHVMKDNMTVWMMNYWLRSGNKALFGIPIEPRTPFLDYRVVEFAFSLPPEYLIRNGWHKWVLREATRQILPPEIVWRRKKMGFPFPLKKWLMYSKETVAANMKGLDCPYVIGRALMTSYDELVQKNPAFLWRMICLALWWRKIVENRKIVPQQLALIGA